MAPHAPEEEGWTIVGRVRSKGSEKVGKGRTFQKILQLDQGAALNGWGGALNFYGQRSSFPKKKGKKKVHKESISATDEVSRLVKKIDNARLAVEASEFYQHFLEEWKAKGLSKPLEQQEDMAPVLLRSEEHLSQEPPLKTSPESQVLLDICPGNVKSALDCTGNVSVSVPEQDNCRSRRVSADLYVQRKGDGQKTGRSDQACPLSNHVSGGFNEEVRGKKPQTLDIVVYGVGSISGNETSRCQLAFALLLRQLLRRPNRVLVYDPAFSEVDHQAIQQLCCDIIGVNEEGKRSAERPTLFYMPHCEEWMYDNVLAANWGAEHLGRVAILGNSFSNYYDRLGLCSAAKRAKMWHIQHVASVLEEVQIHDHGFQNASAFNDMSWHTFGAVSTHSLLPKP